MKVLPKSKSVKRARYRGFRGCPYIFDAHCIPLFLDERTYSLFPSTKVAYHSTFDRSNDSWLLV